MFSNHKFNFVVLFSFFSLQLYATSNEFLELSSIKIELPLTKHFSDNALLKDIVRPTRIPLKLSLEYGTNILQADLSHIVLNYDRDFIVHSGCNKMRAIRNVENVLEVNRSYLKFSLSFNIPVILNHLDTTIEVNQKYIIGKSMIENGVANPLLICTSSNSFLFSSQNLDFFIPHKDLEGNSQYEIENNYFVYLPNY